jgi:glucokinase
VNRQSPRVWIGIDIGGTKTAIVISGAPPAADAGIRFATMPEAGPARALALIKRGVRALLARRGLNAAAIRAIGVSCGGPLDRKRGVIQSPPNLPTWVDVPIARMLRREFGARCLLENDANASAVAEHRWGAGRGCRDMVFLTMGTGLGAGIIIGGRLYRGASDLAGEIGHVRLTRGGPIGHGKRGSAEGWASGAGMAQIARRAVLDAHRRGTRTALHSIVRSGAAITARDVASAAKHGDRVATAIARTSGERLGAVLAILVDILNPERIVIGGLAPRFGDLLLAPAREIMMREAIGAAAKSCAILPAVLGERIGDVAALCVAQGF